MMENCFNYKFQTMKSCIFCLNSRVLSIHDDFGNSSHSAKDDMIQFFGHQIECHLRPEDSICIKCMNVMENIAKLKRRLMPLIFRLGNKDLDDCKPINFGSKWDILASVNFDDESDSFLVSRSPTPHTLLTCRKVVPYEIPREREIAERERKRTSSRATNTQSETNSEILTLLKRKKRRKRGNNWSRRKNGRYSRTSREGSAFTSRTRCVSAASSDSYETFFPPGKATKPATPAKTTLLKYLQRTPTPPPKPKLRYRDGCLQNKITRSVTKQLEEDFNLDESVCQDDDLLDCGIDGCGFMCEDLDLLTQHKVEVHRLLALYFCENCGLKYVSEREVEIHRKTHAEMFPCVICHREFTFVEDLQEHWQVHVRQAVPCGHCGKKFLNRNVCFKHQLAVHSRHDPNRVDYDKSGDEDRTNKKEFQIKYLIQANEDAA